MYFSEREEKANDFVFSKRVVPPVQYRSGEKFKHVGIEPVAFINISSSESDSEDENVLVDKNDDQCLNENMTQSGEQLPNVSSRNRIDLICALIMIILNSSRKTT